MHATAALPRRGIARSLLALFGALLVLGLAGCASLIQREPVRINVVGLEPLPGAGMEMRFAVKLRVQNPNEAAIDFDGLALELDLNGKPFATGVSDRSCGAIIAAKVAIMAKSRPNVATPGIRLPRYAPTAVQPTQFR